MRNPTCIHPVVGIDVGTKKSQIAIVLADCEPESFSIQTTSVAFQEFFSRRVFTRIVLEAGGSSAWIARLLGSMGHHVVVVDSRQSGLKHLVQQKTDKNDAAALAFLALSPRLLREVRHAPEEIESDRALLDYRTKIVSQRTSLVNFTRGKLTSLGIRVPSGSTEAFPRRAAPLVPEGLSDTLELALRRISELTAEISKVDRMVARMLERYPVAEILQTIHGVGPIISARFILRVFDPARFSKNRQVGSYLGLTPRIHQSGDRSAHNGITKAGDREMRRLLVQAAHRALGNSAPDSDIKRFGLSIAGRGGKNAKGRAVVAVARRLAVLMLSMWKSGETWEPLRIDRQRNSSAA